MTKERSAAEQDPVARVLPLLALAHLDREFDYLVPQELSDAAQPGVRVRVRFAGRLVDGFVVARTATSEHQGKFGWLERVVSPEVVLTPDIAALVDAVADRYAGTRADVLRLAIPPRHAKVEAEKRPETTPGDGAGTAGAGSVTAEGDSAGPADTGPVDAVRVEATGWGRYVHGGAFVDALVAGRSPRAVWQALPGEAWAKRLAELTALIASTGKSAVVVVPDQRDLDRVVRACTDIAGAHTVVGLAAGLGPSARYRRWLAALRGDARIVVGTRAAVFAPTPKLGLVVLWDDGDDNLSEPRAPYPHAREVALLRAHLSGCAFLLGAHSRTAEAQALVDSGWAHDLVASRDMVRSCAPKITALADSDQALARDPGARAARLPAIAFAAARAALKSDRPVLVQVPRRGYVPSLACGKCRAPARCRRCNGPLALPAAPGADGAAAPACTWCGVADAAHRCHACGGRTLRAVVVGAGRTAEELGRAFPGVTVRMSGGSDVLSEVPTGPALVVATVGAEPVAPNGYGAALLLDGWALLGRADLRAAEEALRRWMTASAMVAAFSDGGQVVVVADSGIPTVQALVRWDPVGHAQSQIEERAEVGFPPMVHLAAVDGSPEAIGELVDSATLPDGAEVLGPVDLPAGARLPFAGDEPEPEEVARMLVRVPRALGRDLARALAAAQSARSARRSTRSVRIQIDPARIG